MYDKLCVKNMKIIGITEEPDVLLSDNQRLQEQT